MNEVLTQKYQDKYEMVIRSKFMKSANQAFDIF